METIILRTIPAAGGKIKPFWIMANAAHRLNGRLGESKRHLYERWIAAYGKPEKLIRYTGILRPAEAAMTLADLARPATATN